jgi:hypothetical protein
MKRWSAIFFAGLLTMGAARATDRIWTGLVLAATEEPAKAPAAELEPYVDQMREIFGYNTYYLIEDDKEKIVKGTEEWVMPTKRFFLKLRCNGRTDSAYQVGLELYVDDRFILTSDVELARDAPLFIRGPQWGKGRLIFILEVR